MLTGYTSLFSVAVLCTACSWKLSVLFASAFMQAANVFLQVHNAFLQAINMFMQPVTCSCRFTTPSCRLSTRSCRLPTCSCRFTMPSCRLSMRSCRLSTCSCALHSHCTNSCSPKMLCILLVITWRGGMLLVYSARHPRARSARGGGRNKPQHTDEACYNLLIANYDVKFPVTVVTVTSALAI